MEPRPKLLCRPLPEMLFARQRLIGPMEEERLIGPMEEEGGRQCHGGSDCTLGTRHTVPRWRRTGAGCTELFMVLRRTLIHKAFTITSSYIKPYVSHE